MRVVLSYLLWPGLFCGCVALSHLGVRLGHEVLVFNLIYLGLAVVLAGLERLMPYERRWLANDGQIGADLGHTVLTKGVAQVMVVAGAAMGLAQQVDPSGGHLWPTGWPLVLQVVLGLVIADFGLYWAHRLAHQWQPLWRFHAVHHSATRLWFFNTGRFHFVDVAASILLSQPLLFLAGAPKEVFLWVVGLTAIIGMLTHCNVEMRLGVISYVFNTPALHRWHHSRTLSEGNRNYGENLVIWDQVFGTYYNPDRRPSPDIGIDEPIPRSFLGQLRAPFQRSSSRP